MSPQPPQPVRLAKRLRGVSAYRPPERPGRPLLRLDANEGAPGDDARRAAVAGDIELARYPDASELERDIAERIGVTPGRVVVTNGADDAIDRTCRALLDPGDTLLTHTPGFEMIPRSAGLCGAQTHSIEWIDGAFPLDPFVSRTGRGTKLAALVSPNNPTGRAIPTEAIDEILAAAETAGAALLLDQAYIEFADVDPLPNVISSNNTIVTRTFSKAFGLAGLRVGYAIAPEPIADALRAAGGPFPVAARSLAIARAALAEPPNTTPTKARRDTLTRTLRTMGVETAESQANFVFARFDDAPRVHAALLDEGISVRRFPTGSTIADRLRISVPTNNADLKTLTDALTTVLAAGRTTP